MADNRQNLVKISAAIFADNLMHYILTRNNIQWDYLHSNSHLNQEYFNDATEEYLEFLVKSEKSTAFIKLVHSRSTGEDCLRAIETFRSNFKFTDTTTVVEIVTFCQDIALLSVFIWLLRISEERTAAAFCNGKLLQTAYQCIAKIARGAIYRGKILPVENDVVRVALLHAAQA